MVKTSFNTSTNFEFTRNLITIFFSVGDKRKVEFAGASYRAVLKQSPKAQTSQCEGRKRIHAVALRCPLP